MADKLVIYFSMALATLLIFTSCLEDVDFSGFATNYIPVNERFEQSVSWNNRHPQKMIKVDSTNYSLFVAADVHIGGTDNFDQFITDGLNAKTEAFILAGDVVSGHKHDYDTLIIHLKDTGQTPTFLMTGNHDLYFKGWQYFYSYFGSSTYTVLIETEQHTDLLLCLDSGSGTLGKKQLSWLKAQLERRDQFRYCMVITHNNFFRARHTTSTNPQIDELYILLDWFYNYDVNLVVMGHDHKHSIEVFGPTTYITMDALKDDFKHASYLKLQIQGEEINYNFISP